MRVLVVSAPSAGDPALVTQERWLRGAGAGLRERDMVVIRIVGPRVVGPATVKQDAGALRAAAGLPPDRFGVVLIGKDGHEALNRSQPLAMTALFATIDAMPMRREEMARRKP